MSEVYPARALICLAIAIGLGKVATGCDSENSEKWTADVTCQAQNPKEWHTLPPELREYSGIIANRLGVSEDRIHNSTLGQAVCERNLTHDETFSTTLNVQGIGDRCLLAALKTASHKSTPMPIPTSTPTPSRDIVAICAATR